MFTKLCQARVNLFRRAKLIILCMCGFTFVMGSTNNSQYAARGISSVASSAKEIFGKSRGKKMSEEESKKDRKERAAQIEAKYDKVRAQRKSHMGKDSNPEKTT